MTHNSYNIKKITSQIKNKAAELGFTACGISKIRSLEKEKSFFKNWLNKGHCGQMDYLKNNIDKRFNPGINIPNSNSIISVILNYNPVDIHLKSGLKIAKYAYSTDYHFLVKNKLRILISFLKELCAGCQAVPFVDSAPVAEKTWAQNAGLGWIGKNSLLINRNHGSFFYIGEIITNLEFEYDVKGNDNCGSCNKCIESCPTQAINNNKSINAGKCISYLTIESNNEINKIKPELLNNYIFGCDICQDVCPYNSKLGALDDMISDNFRKITGMTLDEMKGINNSLFKKIFSDSAVKRTGLKQLKRNIDYISGKQ